MKIKLLNYLDFSIVIRLKEDAISPRSHRKGSTDEHDAPWKQEWNEKKRRPKSEIEISSPTEVSVNAQNQGAFNKPNAQKPPKIIGTGMAPKATPETNTTTKQLGQSTLSFMI